MGQLCRRAHLQRGSSDDQAVGAVDQFNCTLIGFFREEFAVEGDIRADQFPADGTSRNCIGALKNEIFIILPAAGNTVI